MCASIITMLCLGYYNGSDTFFLILKSTFGATSTNAEYQLGILAIFIFFSAFNLYILRQKNKAPRVLTGFEKKLKSLTKGLFFKRKSFFTVLLFIVFTLTHVVKLQFGGFSSHILSYVMILAVLANMYGLRNIEVQGDSEIAGTIKKISKIEQFEADCDKF